VIVFMLLTSSSFEKTYFLHHLLIAKISKLQIFIFHFSRDLYRLTKIILHYINFKYLSQLFFFFTHHQIIFLLLLNFISYLFLLIYNSELLYQQIYFLLLLNFISYLFLLIYNSELLYQQIYFLLSSFSLFNDLISIFNNIFFLSSLCWIET